jgi:hypothetical protein
MPDIPLEIEGNAQEFRIHLTNVVGPRTFQVDPAGKGILALSPKVDFLRIRVTNKEGLSVSEPLGTGWTVTIEELVKPTP